MQPTIPGPAAIYFDAPQQHLHNGLAGRVDYPVLHGNGFAFGCVHVGTGKDSRARTACMLAYGHCGCWHRTDNGNERTDSGTENMKT